MEKRTQKIWATSVISKNCSKWTLTQWAKIRPFWSLCFHRWAKFNLWIALSTSPQSKFPGNHKWSRFTVNVKRSNLVVLAFLINTYLMTPSLTLSRWISTRIHTKVIWKHRGTYVHRLFFSAIYLIHTYLCTALYCYLLHSCFLSFIFQTLTFAAKADIVTSL
jgi:hypothetical protein